MEYWGSGGRRRRKERRMAATEERAKEAKKDGKVAVKIAAEKIEAEGKEAERAEVKEAERVVLKEAMMMKAVVGDEGEVKRINGDVEAEGR